MSVGKVEEAKRVLTMYSNLAKNPIDLNNVNLVVGKSESKDKGLSTYQRVSYM
jgi:hypothetical protein